MENQHLQNPKIINSNLWKHVMFHPTAAFNYIFANKRQMSLLYLFLFGGAVSGIERLLDKNTVGDPFDYGHLTISILAGAALGWISYYILALILSFAGNYLKGKASDRDFRIVIAWALIPTIFSLFVLIPQFIIYGAGSNDLTFSTYLSPRSLFLISLKVISAILGIWSFVILVKGVAYIQNFSIKRAILNIIAPILIIVGIILLFLAIIGVANII